MPRPVLYVAITNHGFGHATRAASVAATVQTLCPEIDIILATTAPDWLLESYMAGPYKLRSRAFDVGVIQADSLTMDKSATLTALQTLQTKATDLVVAEAEFLNSAGVGLVLGDIPPLAVPLAHRAGVPCWMMSNFGWDFIYQPWGDEFAAVVDWIQGHFSQCDHLFRLPFHESMAAFPHVTDVGLTGGSPRYGEDHLRSRWDITAPVEKTVLLTFGGLGLAQIPYAGLSTFPDWQFITFDLQAPPLANVRQIQNVPLGSDLDPRSYRPVDLMPLCGRVVSKPGFSTFSEACRLGIPLVTITRDDFAESPLLISGIQAHHPHQVLCAETFFAGDWSFLQATPTPPQSEIPLDREGNSAIAQAIIEFLLT
ncbi:hypothetical protein [Leptolyngbya sp. PCC 6406]|uniref:hypothetical protein n=1 Tax=Leptolyngbya sp. PCC 6406 TaxID=1173264 RepID=UPI0002AC9F58|nr:hypothetical protein [Leptolyngbya sp. PCC 6406]